MKSLSVILLIIPCSLWAQEFTINLSQKHVNKIENAKTAREKLKRYRKFYTKDSLKKVKKNKRYWKYKSDSLSKSVRNSNELREYAVYLPDSLNRDSIKSQTLIYGKEQLMKNEEAQTWEEYAGEAGKYKGVLNDHEKTRELAGGYGKQVENRLTERKELQELTSQQAELNKLKEMPETYQSQVEGYQDQLNGYKDSDQLKGKSKDLVKEKASAFFTENAKELKALQRKIKVLQNKYSKVVNSNDLTTAVKRNSLEGKPFRERLFISGYFNVNSTDPISLDLSPKLGYKINGKWIVGLGGTYRKTFSNDSLNTNLNTPENGYGFSGFSSYDAIRGFFVYGEYERMMKEVRQPNSESSKNEWIDGLLLGVGRKFNVHPKVNMQVIALYNFFHEPDNALYPRPWNIKVGFSLSELAMLKK